MRRALSLGLLCVLPALETFANSWKLVRGEQFVLEKGDTVREELWLIVNHADVRGLVQNDVLAVGNRLVFCGELGDDLWAAGSEVTIQGGCGGHLRFLGQSLECDGDVAGNLFAVGQSVTLGANAMVGGDVIVAGQTVVMNGSVAGRGRIIAETVTLAGRFGGTVRVDANDLVVQPGTEIEGDLEYTLPRELFLDERVKVAGRVIRREDAPRVEVSPAMRFWLQGALLASALPVGLLFLAFAPGLVGQAVRVVRHSLFTAAILGAISLVLCSVAIVTLPISLVGLPLSLTLLAALFLGVYLAKFVVALALGSALLRRHGPQSFGRAASIMVVGLVLLYILASVPKIGVGVMLLTIVLGLGGLILAAFRSAQAVSGEPPPAPPAPPPLPDEEPQ